MKIYALLIGINDYPGAPLHKCVHDTEEMANYLKGLALEDLEVNIGTLQDSDATKEGIIAGIEKFLGNAGDEDVALLYYSGHGAHEEAAGRFPTEHDGLLECLVCYHTENQESGFLLADKEIRYLLAQLPNDPHLVTIFDCCHSGDIVRAGGAGEEQIKRLSGSFPARDYQEFIFSEAVSEADLREKPLAQNLPFKNHVHIAACSSSESSWEGGEGGVFTNYLLGLLRATKGRLSYQDVARWAMISMVNVTKKKQSPVISVQGSGPVNQYNSWLNLHPVGSTPEGNIVWNQSGWIYTRGELMGINKGMEVEVKGPSKTFTAVITDTALDHAFVEDILGKDPELDKLMDVPNPEPPPLEATTLQPVYTGLKIFVNDVDREPEIGDQIAGILSQQNQVQKATAGDANFYLNNFNETVYFSLPESPFQPLTQQIDLLQDSVSPDDLEKELLRQLSYIVKWHHFDSLENPGKDFDQPPIKVELNLFPKPDQPGEWIEVTNRTIEMEPFAEPDADQEYYRDYLVRVTNVSDETLYVAALSLNSDFSITADQFYNQTIELQPGESKLFFEEEEKGSTISAYLDTYKAVYNWQHEWFHYKFLVNNFDTLTTAVDDFLQPALEPPLTIENTRGDIPKGQKLKSERKKIERKWGTVKTTIHLNNPKYNIISGSLLKNWEDYSSSEMLAPFISQVYLENSAEGLVNKKVSKPNRTGEDLNEKSLMAIAIPIGNFLDNFRRKRKFRKARKAMIGRPVVVAEGDSWFLFPILVKDTIDYVMERYPVRSIAAAGDELEGYKKTGQMLKEVAEIRPDYVLISGGGNDIIGPEIADMLLEGVAPGQSPRDYLNDEYDRRTEKLKELYTYFFDELDQHHSVKRVFVHGYDFVRADLEEKVIKKGWVNKHMLEKKIDDPTDRSRIINFLVDNFNQMLEDLSKDYDKVTYLNMRGQIASDEWHDEIHPNDVGFAKVGNGFIAAIADHEAKINAQ